MAIGDPVVVINPGGHSYSGKKSGVGTVKKNVAEGQQHSTAGRNKVKLDRSGKTAKYKSPIQHKMSPKIADTNDARMIDKSTKLKEPNLARKSGRTQTKSRTRGKA
tara:strand:- start:1214 stop:1531 length:318 start_codon:yes stop_codon:yes gene_type:complete